MAFQKVLLILFVVFLASCGAFDPKADEIYFINKSDDIVVCPGYSDNLKYWDVKQLFDSKCRFFGNKIPENASILSGKQSNLIWGPYFENKMILYIVKHKTIKKYGWEKIISSQLYDDKIELTLLKLKMTHWKVIYE